MIKGISGSEAKNKDGGLGLVDAPAKNSKY